MTAMIFVLRSGCPWRALPEGFGPWQTVDSRRRPRCGKGVVAGRSRFCLAQPPRRFAIHRREPPQGSSRTPMAGAEARSSKPSATPAEVPTANRHAMVDGKAGGEGCATAGQVSDMKIGPGTGEGVGWRDRWRQGLRQQSPSREAACPGSFSCISTSGGVERARSTRATTGIVIMWKTSSSGSNACAVSPRAMTSLLRCSLISFS